MIQQYPDKLGVYRVGDLKFYSKLEAIECMQKTGIHLHWDFNEAVYSSYDWTVEPTENILELYRQRAQELRDQYDYIVLMYSGGADSQNILDTFTNNDIKLDEIASYINYDATGDKENFLNAEAFNTSIPCGEKLKIKYPWIHHRIIDLTKITLDFFNPSDSMFSWIYRINNFFNPNCVSRESLPLKIKEWSDIIHSGKKLCILWGHDKPRVLHIDGKFLLRFIDFIDSGPTTQSIAGQQPYVDELFYWTPDLPKIVIKQAHIIKNYLSLPNFQNLPFVSTHKSDLGYREVDGIKYWLSNHGVHTLIYPTWDIKTFSTGKPKSIVFTPRDTWFFDLEESITAKYHWRVGLQKLNDLIPEYWKIIDDDFSQGLVGCWSKSYYLEK